MVSSENFCKRATEAESDPVANPWRKLRGRTKLRKRFMRVIKKSYLKEFGKFVKICKGVEKGSSTIKCDSLYFSLWRKPQCLQRIVKRMSRWLFTIMIVCLRKTAVKSSESHKEDDKMVVDNCSFWLWKTLRNLKSRITRWWFEGSLLPYDRQIRGSCGVTIYGLQKHWG